jgi:hypothetical protein
MYAVAIQYMRTRKLSKQLNMAAFQTGFEPGTCLIQVRRLHLLQTIDLISVNHHYYLQG